MQIITQPITREELKNLILASSSNLVKAVVDIEKKIMALGGAMHADEEALLLAEGSQQRNLWGINIYPEEKGERFVEFDSMINLRPSQGNRTRGVDDSTIREQIIKVVHDLVE